MIALRQIFVDEASALNLEEANVRSKENSPLYIDRAKIVNSQWQLNTPLSRTLHAISASLKISARVWGVKFHTDTNCRGKSFGVTARTVSRCACMRAQVCDLCDLLWLTRKVSQPEMSDFDETYKKCSFRKNIWHVFFYSC